MIIIQSKDPQQELEKKILALLRQERIPAEQFSFSSQQQLTFHSLTIDGKSQQVFQNGKKIPLTRLEFNLLMLLACNAGTVLSKEEIFCAVWGRDNEDTMKVVANTISNLRRKLRDGVSGQDYIQAVRGGYVLRWRSF